MIGEQTGAYLEMWHALGQITPFVESADTLGTTIATALCQVVGAGKTAIILPVSSAAGPAALGEPTAQFFLRLVGPSSAPSPPIYLHSDHGFFTEAMRSTRHLKVSAPWPADYADDELLQLADSSILVVPIHNAHTELKSSFQGAICLLDVPPDRLPGPVELATLESYTRVALSLLENKTSAARQAVEYRIISEVGRSLTSSLSLDDIFGQILNSVRTAIDAAEISVGLIDTDTQEVVLEKSLMGPEFRALPPIRLQIGQGVAGWVAQTGIPLNVPDARADPRWFSGVDAASGFITRSILCVPLMVDEQVIGIMEVVNKRTGHFTDDDERLLTALSSSAAIAIAKARLHADVLAEKRRMEAIFANMSEGLLTMRLNGLITAVNPALENLVAIPEHELLGKHCRQAIKVEPDTLENLLQHMQAPVQRSQPFHEACDIIRPDGGHVPVLISAAATAGDSDEALEIVVVFSYIGQIRELERMKDDFVINVTHELRTPLATILLYARLLKAGKTKDDPEREARYLEIVEQQSNHLQKLVRQVLDLSRMEVTLKQPATEQIEVHRLMDELLIPFQKHADQKGLALHTDLPDELPALLGSPEAAKLIFRNLIDNALKFTAEGTVTVSARIHGERMQIDVTDDGIGIAPESIPYLFQRFYRTQEAVERGIGGTGLGLALVKEAVDKLGGEILVSSVPKRGSTFSVLLPIADLSRSL